MAATAAAAELTRVHRLAQVRLSAELVTALDDVWPLLDPAALDATYERWLGAVARQVKASRSQSARLAGRYMSTFKQLELGAGARARVVLVEAVEPAALSTSLTVTGPVRIKAATRIGQTLDVAARYAQTSTTGAAIRHMLGGARDTITQTIHADEHARGWARVTSGAPCAFCAMTAGRGAIYKDEDTAGFEPHDNCHCEPEPIYRDDAKLPPGSERFADMWKAASADDGDTEQVFRQMVEAGA